LPGEIPREEYPPPSTFIEEATQCVKETGEQGMMLRVIGGLGVHLHGHSQEYTQLAVRLGRFGQGIVKDIDFASYGKFRDKMYDFFTKRGYKVHPSLHMHYFRERHMYFAGKVPMVEVFFDKLRMNHTIRFAGRLEADNPTLPLAELLLVKLQLVRINEKDIKDAVLLLWSHDVGETDNDMVNLNAFRGAGLLSDWGFYYTITTNLKKVQRYIQQSNILNGDDARIVGGRVVRILDFLDKQPKSQMWKLREKIGPRKKWYNDVEEWAGL
jgi:hypothetical protein